METCLDLLRQRFERDGVAFEVIRHPHAETSQEASAAAGISGYAFAKPVVVVVDDQPQLFVLRAADRIDMKSLRSQLRPRLVRIANEYETHPLFPGCESGGIPAIPLQEDMPVYIDRWLAQEPTITFEAGSSTEAVRMQMADYLRLVRPRTMSFAEEPVRRRRPITRTTVWRRRAMQAAPFVAALSAMVLGPRVIGRRRAAIRTFALGIIAGAATSSLTEPRSGGRRRALLRDKSGRWLRQSLTRLERRGRYSGGRLRGLRHRAGISGPDLL